MATNKRKESAALFELIGKSTLKVPKNAGGSLKIPGWWSSKSNAPAAPPNASPDGRSRVPPPMPATPAGAAPSIRPPAPPAAASLTPAAPAASSVHPPHHGVFAPNTADPGAGHSLPPQRLPLWALVVAAIICLVLVILTIHALDVLKRTPARTPSPVATARAAVVNNNNPPVHPVPPPHRVETPVEPTERHGRIVPGNQIQRRPDYYYLVITTSRTQQVALDNAKFITDHGPDDVVVGRSGNFFTVVSAEGFPKRDTPQADALAKRIREVGRLHADAKRLHKGVYDDAYFDRITPASR